MGFCIKTMHFYLRSILVSSVWFRPNMGKLPPTSVTVIQYRVAFSDPYNPAIYTHDSNIILMTYELIVRTYISVNT